jgi:hypothetical protein
MSSVSSATRRLAHHILTREAGSQATSAMLTAATERICQRLRWRLTSLIGSLGFAALYSRALRLAQQEYPSLHSVEFSDGAEVRLIGLQEFAADVRDPVQAQDALAAIVAQFIVLLIAFIGEDLTLRFIDEAWHDHAGIAPDLYGERQSDA